MVWRVDTGGRIDAKPLLHEGTIYIGSQDDRLYALDPVTGETRWRYEAGASITATAAVHGDSVLVGDLDGWVHAVSRDAGARIWRKGRKHHKSGG